MRQPLRPRPVLIGACLLVVASVLAIAGVGWSGRAHVARLVDERDGALRGVRFGESEAQVRARLGEPTDHAEGFFPKGGHFTGPPVIAVPRSDQHPRRAPTPLHYEDSAYLVSPSVGVVAMATDESRARTRAGVAVGDDLELVSKRYDDVTCGRAIAGEPAFGGKTPTYRWCRATVGKIRAFFGGDPIDSVTLTRAPSAATSASAVPDVARIACGTHTTGVLTPRARPQQDGIHLRFGNRAGKELSYTVESPSAGGRGDRVPASGTEVVVSLPPGELDVVCFDPNSREDPSEKKRARVEIVDPVGLWTPTLLSDKCKMRGTTFADYAAGTTGEHGPLVAIARRLLSARGVLEPRDSLGRAGYPVQRPPVISLVRNGEAVALLEFMSDEKGGWLLSTTNACTGIGLG